MENASRQCPKSTGDHLNWLGAFSSSSLRHELLEAAKRLEHRVEVLSSLSHQHQSSEPHELAEAYKRHAEDSRKRAQLIRKILDLKDKGG